MHSCIRRGEGRALGRGVGCGVSGDRGRMGRSRGERRGQDVTICEDEELEGWME